MEKAWADPAPWPLWTSGWGPRACAEDRVFSQGMGRLCPPRPACSEARSGLCPGDRGLAARGSGAGRRLRLRASLGACHPSRCEAAAQWVPDAGRRPWISAAALTLAPRWVGLCLLPQTWGDSGPAPLLPRGGWGPLQESARRWEGDLTQEPKAKARVGLCCGHTCGPTRLPSPRQGGAGCSRATGVRLSWGPVP